MNHKKTCCVCFTSEKVHKFPQGRGPSTAERFATWANFAALENVLGDQKCYALCEKHFERRMFINDLSSRLVKPAFPTLHPPVYHGPRLMDSTVVEPSIPKAEAFKLIYHWKENNLLIAPPSPPSSVERKSSSQSPGTGKRSTEKDKDISQQLVKQPSDCLNKPLLRSDKKTLLNSSVENSGTRLFSLANSPLQVKFRKNQLSVEKYSRNTEFSKIKPTDNTVPKLVTDSSDTESEKLASFEIRTLSSEEDKKSTAVCSSLLVSLADRPLSPVTEPMSAGMVLTPTNVDGSFIFPAVEAILTDAEMEFSFTNIISSMSRSPENEKDSHLATTNNTDTSFNQGKQLCIVPKKKKRYNPVQVDSL